jgi:hypothetical protein
MWSLLQNSSRRTSKAWGCNIGKAGDQSKNTRIEDEIERGCKKQNKKPDQETDYEEEKKGERNKIKCKRFFIFKFYDM